MAQRKINSINNIRNEKNEKAPQRKAKCFELTEKNLKWIKRLQYFIIFALCSGALGQIIYS